MTSVSSSRGSDVGGGADGAANESVSFTGADDYVAEAAGGVIAAAGPAMMVGSIVAATTEARPR